MGCLGNIVEKNNKQPQQVSPQNKEAAIKAIAKFEDGVAELEKEKNEHMDNLDQYIENYKNKIAQYNQNKTPQLKKELASFKSQLLSYANNFENSVKMKADFLNDNIKAMIVVQKGYFQVDAKKQMDELSNKVETIKNESSQQFAKKRSELNSLSNTYN